MNNNYRQGKPPLNFNSCKFPIAKSPQSSSSDSPLPPARALNNLPTNRRPPKYTLKKLPPKLLEDHQPLKLPLLLDRQKPPIDNPANIRQRHKHRGINPRARPPPLHPPNLQTPQRTKRTKPPQVQFKQKRIAKPEEDEFSPRKPLFAGRGEVVP